MPVPIQRISHNDCDSNKDDHRPGIERQARQMPHPLWRRNIADESSDEFLRREAGECQEDAPNEPFANPLSQHRPQVPRYSLWGSCVFFIFHVVPAWRRVD
uniref:Uncharacterized protein n=2 Tax=Ralstonia solanacearum TaxID=305 RepID=A0A0S4WIP6_RALSL|nr:conserved protein of unknown function [Ralstonia solanacearum]